MEKTNNGKKMIFKVIFLISLLYYVWWIIFAVDCYINGIDSGWIMPAMSSHELDYGFEAVQSAIAIAALYTIEKFWFIPLYQIIYIIYSIGSIRNKRSSL